MKICYRDGKLTGVFRDPQDGEGTLEVNKSEAIWGYDTRLYEVIDNTFTPLPVDRVEAIRSADYANVAAAKEAEESLKAEVQAEKLDMSPQEVRDFIDSKFTKDMTEREAIVQLIQLVKRLAVLTLQ